MNASINSSMLQHSALFFPICLFHSGCKRLTLLHAYGSQGPCSSVPCALMHFQPCNSHLPQAFPKMSSGFCKRIMDYSPIHRTIELALKVWTFLQRLLSPLLQQRKAHVVRRQVTCNFKNMNIFKVNIRTRSGQCNSSAPFIFYFYLQRGLEKTKATYLECHTVQLTRSCIKCPEVTEVTGGKCSYSLWQAVSTFRCGLCKYMGVCNKELISVVLSLWHIFPQSSVLW